MRVQKRKTLHVKADRAYRECKQGKGGWACKGSFGLGIGQGSGSQV